MKQWTLLIALLLAALALAGCAGKGEDVAQDTAQEVAQDISQDVAQASAAQDVAQARPIDLDLSALSGTVVYSQVYDMMANTEQYAGQTIRARGNFSYFQDPDTRQEYFAVVIADAAACCAQGIEFVWAGEHAYPRDYPPLDAEITVTGVFGAYQENGLTYVQLADADVQFDA